MAGLNEQQEAAVDALTGRVLISAGAGSGKTRTLSERFARSLTDALGERWSAAGVGDVLAITFTDKAAGELAERIRGTLRHAGRLADARAVDGAWISTIHGFCSRLLRRHALEAGLDPSFGVADTVETWRLKEQAFEEAARSASATPEGEQLLGAFEFDAVFKAADSVATGLRTRGLDTSAVQLEPVTPAKQLFDEALAVFAGGVRRVEACGDVRVSAAKLRSGCESVAGALGELDGERLEDAVLAAQVWRALEPWTAGRGSKAIDDVRLELKAEHTRLLGDAAAAAATPFARGLLGLVVDYSRRFAALKSARGLLDFDDLQIEALRLLEGDAEIRDAYRAAFRLVMVDEFQDTDELQLRLVKAVAGEELCTVGDVRQSIYRFRGADVEVYRRHNDDMRDAGAREFALTLNYRSHADVLSFVGSVFCAGVFFGSGLVELRHGRTEPDVPFVPDGEPRVDVALVHQGGRSTSDGRPCETAAVAGRLARLRDEHGVAPGSMVVLLRSYTHADEYADALRARGFEVVVVGGSRFFGVPEVAMLRALLRVVANPEDDEALVELLASPMGRLSDDGLWLLRNDLDGRRRTSRLWESLGAPGGFLPEADARASAAAVALVGRARSRVGTMPLSELLLRTVEEAGLDLELLAGGNDGRQGYANLLRLVRMADAFEAIGGAGPAAFAAYLDAKEYYGDPTAPATLADEQTPAVRIMSIHASKGLEFPVVAVPELGEPRHGDDTIVRTRAADGRVEVAVRLPSEWTTRSETTRTTRFRQADEGAKEAELEETKRLFYVACTRAEDVLVLSGTGNLDKAADDVAPSLLALLRSAIGPETEPGPDEGAVERPVGAAKARLERIDAAEWVSRHGGGPLPEDGAVTPAPAWEAPPATIEPRAPAPDAPERLSYSDLGLYERCRLRFRAEGVLRVGRLDVSGPEDARRFGSAVHAVLRLVGRDGAPPPRERVDAIGRFHRLDEAGATRLRDAVERFLRSATADALVAHGRVRREWPFATRIDGDAGAFTLAGTIDAYGHTGSDGLIVDYKTGVSGETQELEERYRLQAECYALVALRDGRERVRVVFSRPEAADPDGRPREVAFAFVAADAARIETRVAGLHARMAAGEYDPLPAWRDDTCGDCPIAGGVCPVAVPPGRGQLPAAR